ncbi:hypothetical protein Ptc2401_01342 [Prosthecochloris sp. CIB 2401]|nr:hypothetical protein Ptc2401_01342 [Prosthecochloris sp. CIB 2401]
MFVCGWGGTGGTEQRPLLFDLKRDKLTHQDLGQMQMYVNYFDRYVKMEDELPTIGILLCHRNLAPLVFLNAADSKAAQMFTLAHELAHVWVGISGLSDPDAGRIPALDLERWCNKVAAELLIPVADLREVHDAALPVQEEMQRLARVFKVSTLVVLRRLFDSGLIDHSTLVRCYRDEVASINALERDKKADGGDYYRTLGVRASRRFSRAIVASTMEGHTLFRDAFRLLGMRKSATFFKAARELGVMP